MRVGRVLLALFLALAAASVAGAAEVRNLVFRLADGTELRYGLLLPDGLSPGDRRPLVVALHPGGERMRYYGSAYARLVVVPAVAHLGAIVVAPDCPGESWAEPSADSAVMALVDAVEREYGFDRRRVLITGFSMGGRGTWYLSSRHADFFTAAVPMAASARDLPLDLLATMPTYVVHSRRDQVVPFGPAEETARQLEAKGRRIRFEALTEPTHFEMGAYVPALRRAIDWISTRW